MTVLIDAALHAPLLGVRPDDPELLHAVDMHCVIQYWDSDDGLFVSACGLDGIALVDADGSQSVVPWPPRVASLPAGRKRCKACQMATGNKRPRCSFVRKEQA